jgi:prevent-host-death family protein
MLAKSVDLSVHDLKSRLGAVVARAARGERFVITRYGSPRAVLTGYGAPEGNPPGRIRGPRAAERAFVREERAFDRLLRTGALGPYRGRYVATWDRAVVDADRDAGALVRRVARRLGRRVFFVGFVGSEEPVVDLPGQDGR